MAFDYMTGARDGEQERIRQMLELQQQQEAQAAQQAQERAAQQQQAAQGSAVQTQPVGAPQTLGDLVAGASNPEQAGGYQGPQGGPPAGGVSQAPGGLPGARQDYQGPSASYQHDASRDYSRNPLTGAELDAFGGNPYMSGATTYYGGTGLPQGQATPGRSATDMDVDTFNQGIRGSELYQQFINTRGLAQADGKTKPWSDADRSAWRAQLAAAGVQIPDGMKIDDAGNLNEINKTGKRVAITTAIVAGALLTAGAAGAFAGGAAGAGAAGGGAAAGAGAAGAAGAGAAGAGVAAGVGAGATAAGVGAGAAAGAGAAGVGAAAAGGGMGWGSVISGVAGLGSTYMSSRAQSQAGKQAAAASDRASQSSERILLAQMEAEKAAREQDRQDAERRWAAEQEFARKQWDASEEERLFNRQIFLEDRAAKNSGGGGYSGPSLPDPKALRKKQAQQNLATLLAQGTPGYNPYVPATAAGPLGRA